MASPKTQKANTVSKHSNVLHFGVDTNIVCVHTLDIPLPPICQADSGGGPDETTVPSTSHEPSSSLQASQSSLCNAFTLGVSVRVRPLTPDESPIAVKLATSRAGPASEVNCNAVFVRTVIPGGAAYKASDRVYYTISWIFLNIFFRIVWNAFQFELYYLYMLIYTHFDALAHALHVRES